MKKNLFKTILALMLVAALFVLAGCGSEKEETTTEPTTTEAPATTWKVSIYDSDGVTVLAEVEVEDGKAVTLPELVRDGYTIKGYYATPALLIEADLTAPITEDTSIFVAWQSSVEDTRPWMIAGSLRAYPDNLWGKVWPQDDYYLTPVEGEFNTFEIVVDLFAGDEFKIAVIAEGYVWDDTASVDASMLAQQTEDAALTGGENAFDSGANIKVTQDGKYRLILVTDAETLSLCKLYYERIGDAEAAPEIQYEMKLWASFNNWEGQDMIRNGDDLIWYCEADVPEGGGEFGIKNAATEAWYSSEGNSKNITLDEGHYMFFIELELVDGVPTLKGDIVAEAPAYYVVGTCGNGGWAADANAENTAYAMTECDGVYTITVEFTEAETADWADGQVAFKVVYGCGGRVANEFWYGTEDGGNICVAPGTYTITLDPATGTVTVA